ncbi:MAG: hypothetical protein H8E32_08765 [Nitrospinae bacterium]|nr:hypothetical protein [Nitrospinota bacterium]
MGKKSDGKGYWDNDDDDQYSKYDNYSKFGEFDEFDDLEDFGGFGDFENAEGLEEFGNFDKFSMNHLESSFLKPVKFKNKGNFEQAERDSRNNKPKKSSWKTK